jgi:hypothetical protein
VRRPSRRKVAKGFASFSQKEALFFFGKLISFVLINGQTSIDVWPFSVGSFAFALFRIDAAACHG